MMIEKDEALEHAIPDAPFEIVAIAASAGGLKALSRVLSGLPEGFPAPVLVVQHLDPHHRSMMGEILDKRTPLQVKQAEAGEPVRAGTVFIAPPNHHLLVDANGTLVLTQSELVHFVRPSADLLFESVAGTYKDRVIAVVLTGSGRDGGMGVEAVKKMGGTVIAQNKETADFFSMPETAIETDCVDFILGLDEIAARLIALVREAKAEQE